MLAGARMGKTAWWVAYGAFSLGAMYTHYTAAFVLIVQSAAPAPVPPQARKAALIANVGAAVLYLPWIPGLLDDSGSPTIDIGDVLPGRRLSGPSARRSRSGSRVIRSSSRSRCRGCLRPSSGSPASSPPRWRHPSAGSASVPRRPRRAGRYRPVAAAGSDPGHRHRRFHRPLRARDPRPDRKRPLRRPQPRDLVGRSGAAHRGRPRRGGQDLGMVCTALVIACFGIAAGRSLGTRSSSTSNRRRDTSMPRRRPTTSSSTCARHG